MSYFCSSFRFLQYYFLNITVTVQTGLNCYTESSKGFSSLCEKPFVFKIIISKVKLRLYNNITKFCQYITYLLYSTIFVISSLRCTSCPRLGPRALPSWRRRVYLTQNRHIPVRIRACTS